MIPSIVSISDFLVPWTSGVRARRPFASSDFSEPEVVAPKGVLPSPARLEACASGRHGETGRAV